MSEPHQPAPTNPDDGPHDGDKRARRIEDIFIILCILSLWPVILGWQQPVYEAVLYLALVGLVVILVRRIRRFRDASHSLENSPH